MNILTRPVNSFTFDEVVEFCKENNREGTQLDYKEDLTTGSLSKHFAAFSNTRGGIIIIGVKEDHKTGLPLSYDGINENAQDIERIRQWANNVEPLPKVIIHPTNAINGKRFILIRIYEGDNTPYYIQNNGSIWIRTDNISKELFDIASPDYARLLYDKRNKAKNYRNYYLSRAHDVLLANIISANREKYPNTDNVASIIRTSAFFENAQGMLTVYIQPNFPSIQLAKPNDLIEKLREYRNQGNSYNEFPSIAIKPIPEGVASFSYNVDEIKYTCEQVYAQGLIYLRESIYNTDIQTKVKHIYLDYLLGKMLVLIRVAQKFYKLFDYQGCLKGNVNLFKVRDIMVIPYSQGFGFEKEKILLDSYEWDINVDTNIIFDEEEIHKTFIGIAERIFWDIGFSRAFNSQTIKNYLVSARLMSS